MVGIGKHGNIFCDKDFQFIFILYICQFGIKLLSTDILCPRHIFPYNRLLDSSQNIFVLIDLLFRKIVIQYKHTNTILQAFGIQRGVLAIPLQ